MIETARIGVLPMLRNWMTKVRISPGSASPVLTRLMTAMPGLVGRDLDADRLARGQAMTVSPAPWMIPVTTALSAVLIAERRLTLRSFGDRLLAVARDCSGPCGQDVAGEVGGVLVAAQDAELGVLAGEDAAGQARGAGAAAVDLGRLVLDQPLRATAGPSPSPAARRARRADGASTIRVSFGPMLARTSANRGA